eukprot:5103507-Pleurochrysis_carterae.AAC.1
MRSWRAGTIALRYETGCKCRVLEHSLRGEVNVASAYGDSSMDLDFAREILSRFFEPGKTALACESVEVRHRGTVFGKRSWCASSDGQL